MVTLHSMPEVAAIWHFINHFIIIIIIIIISLLKAFPNVLMRCSF